MGFDNWQSLFFLAAILPLLLIPPVIMFLPSSLPGRAVHAAEKKVSANGGILDRENRAATLLLWIACAFVTYFVNDAFAPHALQGLSFPFAVLAVRGWQRLRLPAALGAVAVALVTIPGLAYDARKFVRTARSTKLVIMGLLGVGVFFSVALSIRHLTGGWRRLLTPVTK